jgi:hypothetical protein
MTKARLRYHTQRLTDDVLKGRTRAFRVMGKGRIQALEHRLVALSDPRHYTADFRCPGALAALRRASSVSAAVRRSAGAGDDFSLTK